MATTAFELQARIGVDSSEYERGLSGAKGALSSFGDLASSIFQKAASAFADFVADSVRTGAEFDKTMSQVAATMGQTSEEVQNLSDFAKEMGATTAFSAQQAAEGLNYMALAGYDAEKSMEMLPKVLDLAAAGCMQLGQASDMVTDAASALQLDAEGTTDLIDQMAKAAASSNTSVSQLGEAILQVGGTAKDLKGGTVELTSVLGILADNGMKGAQGGTALRNMMNSLISPTKDAQEVLDRFGISLFDSRGEMRGMNEVFADLGKSLDKLTTQDRKQAIATLFNARDMKAAEALMANATERYAELSEKIMESEGAAAEMAETQLDNLAGDVTLFKSGLEGLKIAISDSISPFLRSFVKSITNSIGDIKKLVENLTGAFNTNGFRGLATMIGLEFDTIRSRVNRFSSEVLPTLTSKITEAASEIPTFILNVVKQLTDGESGVSLMDIGFQIINAVVDGLLSKESLDQFAEAAPLIIKGLSSRISSFLFGSDKNTPGGLFGAILNIAQKIRDYLEDPKSLEKFREASKDALENLGQFLVDNVGLLAKYTLQIGQALAEGIIAAFISDFKHLFGGLDERELMNEYMETDTTETYDQFRQRRLREMGRESSYEIEERYPDYVPTATYTWTNSSTNLSHLPAAARDQLYRATGRGYATGGIFDRPTYALIGEDGKEAVVPLEKNTGWIDMLAERLGGGGVVIQFGDIHVNGTENVGREVVSQIDSALKQYQIMQQRGIGGTGWR